jgi:hypothetical protein
MKLERKQPLTKEWLFSHIDSYQVYQYYVPNLKIQYPICSPLRSDRSPSWRVFPCDGVLLWKDMSTDEAGDCVTMVMKMFQIKYHEAIQRIAQDMGIVAGNNNTPRVIQSHYKVEECKPALIQVTARKVYTAADREWWGRYMIGTDDLKKGEIESVTEVYINRKKYHIDKRELVYAYRFPDDKFKIYMPERSKEQGKWLSNISQKYIEGYSQLNGDPKVLITKSRKDKILLSKIIPYPVMAVQNESGSGFSEEVVKKLSAKEVIINYDADPTGVTNCKKLCDKYHYNWLNTPKELMAEGIKDCSDWVAKRGSIKELEQYLIRKGIII